MQYLVTIYTSTTWISCYVWFLKDICTYIMYMLWVSDCLSNKNNAVFQFRWHILATQKCRVPAPSEQAQNWQGTIDPKLFLLKVKWKHRDTPHLKESLHWKGSSPDSWYVDFLPKSVWLFAMILREAEKYHTLTTSPYPPCATNGPSESSWHAWHVTRDFYQPPVEYFFCTQQNITKYRCSCHFAATLVSFALVP